MNKMLREKPASGDAKAVLAEIVIVRNPSTGEAVEVKGVGALRGRTPPIENGISLLRPIAAQVLRPDEKKNRKKTTG